MGKHGPTCLQCNTFCLFLACLFACLLVCSFFFGCVCVCVTVSQQYVGSFLVDLGGAHCTCPAIPPFVCTIETWFLNCYTEGWTNEHDREIQQYQLLVQVLSSFGHVFTLVFHPGLDHVGWLLLLPMTTNTTGEVCHGPPSPRPRLPGCDAQESPCNSGKKDLPKSGPAEYVATCPKGWAPSASGNKENLSTDKDRLHNFLASCLILGSVFNLQLILSNWHVRAVVLCHVMFL